MTGLVDGFRKVVARHGAVVVAGAISLIWLALVGLFWLLTPSPDQPPGALARLMSLVGVLLPVALIWMAAGAAETLAQLRAEADRLRADMDRIRPPARPAPTPIDAVEPATPEVRPAARPAAAPMAAAPIAAAPIAAPQPRARVAAPTAAPTAPQPAQSSLALDLPGAATDSLPADTLIRALNFPESGDDSAGIAALRAALADATASRLVRAAQDVLTLLARDGIFMDDLAPDRARPELWRRFAHGERGREVSALGGVRDRVTLTLVQDLLRSDTIFRDAAHHFLRQFDRALATLEPQADDAQIAAFAATRTARAFMLLGRAAGTFDG
ncbi:hypothetical protein ACEYYB_08605 [Paracoccus sp. p4-l81]|uniref:hypothetical protein n=1 Tax=unclassified Paracoccus (in: a-proteobacteria) TaxID=2688777 RepID=UPI0035B9DBB6